jgi:nucleotidyltransferase substrate binding protein (TIGR01987 family)
MDKLIEIKNQEFKKALENLKLSAGMSFTEIVRDSTLLRFELASELSWKTLRIYLEHKFKIESGYPTSTYRESVKTGMLTPDDVETALIMVEDRNRMVHDYNREWSEELYKRVVEKYIPLLEKVLQATVK